MKLWRVHFHTENGNSLGYEWFRTRREAKAAMEKHVDQEQLKPDDTDQPELEGIEIEISAKGVIDALNVYGGHADNG